MRFRKSLKTLVWVMVAAFTLTLCPVGAYASGDNDPHASVVDDPHSYTMPTFQVTRTYTVIIHPIPGFIPFPMPILPQLPLFGPVVQPAPFLAPIMPGFLAGPIPGAGGIRLGPGGIRLGPGGIRLGPGGIPGLPPIPTLPGIGAPPTPQTPQDMLQPAVRAPNNQPAPTAAGNLLATPPMPPGFRRAVLPAIWPTPRMVMHGVGGEFDIKLNRFPGKEGEWQLTNIRRMNFNIVLGQQLVQHLGTRVEPITLPPGVVTIGIPKEREVWSFRTLFPGVARLTFVYTSQETFSHRKLLFDLAKLSPPPASITIITPDGQKLQVSYGEEQANATSLNDLLGGDYESDDGAEGREESDEDITIDEDTKTIDPIDLLLLPITLVNRARGYMHAPTPNPIKLNSARIDAGRLGLEFECSISLGPDKFDLLWDGSVDENGNVTLVFTSRNTSSR